MHPLEKLAEDWGNVKGSSLFTKEEAGIFLLCADELTGNLASLWHPFDPDDEGTWPEREAQYLTFDELSDYGLEWFRDRQSAGHWEGLGIKAYTELLPGPRAMGKANG